MKTRGPKKQPLQVKAVKMSAEMIEMIRKLAQHRGQSWSAALKDLVEIGLTSVPFYYKFPES